MRAFLGLYCFIYFLFFSTCHTAAPCGQGPYLSYSLLCLKHPEWYLALTEAQEYLLRKIFVE